MVQLYVHRPLLWEGRFKFHLRVYCVLTAQMQFHCYRRAFAHVSNKPFTLSCFDPDHHAPRGAAARGGGASQEGERYFDHEVHITNVASGR